MVYSYLLDLYKQLDKRKETIKAEISQISKDPERYHQQQGRLAAIIEFTDFLESNYHSKLPQRMQRQRKCR